MDVMSSKSSGKTGKDRLLEASPTALFFSLINFRSSDSPSHYLNMRKYSTKSKQKAFEAEKLNVKKKR